MKKKFSNKYREHTLEEQNDLKRLMGDENPFVIGQIPTIEYSMKLHEKYFKEKEEDEDV